MSHPVEEPNTLESSTANGTKKKNDVDYGPNVFISGHPLIVHKITILRSSTTAAGKFRDVLRELTYHLGYEATSNLTTVPVPISVPVTSKSGEISHMDVQGEKLKERVALIPILRSGQGMVEAMMQLLPKAAVHHIGMYKAGTDKPVQYYNRLPRECKADVAIVLDPVIQTSSTIMSVIRILKKWGVSKIHVISVIGSSKGLKALTEAHPDVSFTVGVVDHEVSDDGQVLPGIGDSGDRQFGTAPVIEDDESLLHPSRRKRSLSQSLE